MTMESFNIIFFMVTLLVTACASPSENELGIKIPKECSKNGFCSVKPEGYDKLAEKMNKLIPPHLIKNYADRIGQDLSPEYSPQSDWHNCPYKTNWESSYIYSYDNATKIDIIIQTFLLTQPIQTVNCAYDKIESGTEQCFKHLGLYRLGMTFSCESLLGNRTLLVYDPKTHSITTKAYEVPCCCTCKVRNR